MTQTRQALREIARYVIDSVWEAGANPTRTRLQKLFYLLDLGHAETHSGRTWTGFDWKFHHFGPYSGQLQGVLDSMDGIDADDNEGVGAKGRFHVYSGAHGARDSVDIERLLDAPGRTTLRAILQRWAAADLNELLDHVYFDTHPMAHAQRGDQLRFETSVNDMFLRRAVHNPALSPEVLTRIRAALRSRQQAGGTQVRVEKITRPLGDREQRLLARAEGLPHQHVTGYVDFAIGGEERG